MCTLSSSGAGAQTGQRIRVHIARASLIIILRSRTHLLSTPEHNRTRVHFTHVHFTHILEHPFRITLERACRYGWNSSAQVALGWIAQRGHAIVTKASDPTYLAEDLNLFGSVNPPITTCQSPVPPTDPPIPSHMNYMFHLGNGLIPSGEPSCISPSTAQS
jgi:hypothetical protein